MSGAHVAQALYIADRFIRPSDANSIVLFADALGRFLLGSSVPLRCLPPSEGDRVDIPTAMMAAVKQPDLDAIPTVYVLNGKWTKTSNYC
jgi:hypothetical protein